MTQNVKTIGLNRAKLISVKGDATVSPRLKAIFLSELANLGYKLENPELYNDSVLENFDSIINTLIEMKGGDVNYVPLFSGFPNKVDYDSVLKLTIPGLIEKFGSANYFDFLTEIVEFKGLTSSRTQTDKELEDGIKDQASRKSDKHTVWTNLKFTTDIESDVRTFLKNNLYAKSSIKETLKEDIEFLIKHYGLEFLDAKKVVFKEIKSYVMTYLWNKGDMETLAKYVGTPTDLLRMFAGITGGDISLATPIKFPKMKRSQRRFVLQMIENSSKDSLMIAENLNKYKGLWIKVGKSIHPGEYKNQFPNTFAAFNNLRNEKVITFNGMLEKYIGNKDLEATLKLVTKRPGVFGRKLHEILDVFSTEKGVVKAFKSIASELEIKNLLVLERYFMTINDADFRTVINKRGKVIVFPNDKKGSVTEKRIEKLLSAIKNAIETKMAANPLEFEEGTKVLLDPALRNYMVPLSMRKQSDGLMNISRGTRIAFDNTKILRLFNYWKESEYCTDFDTSLIEFDEDMKMKGQVSWTNLSEPGAYHSGDITSSSNGACEFIDVDLKRLKSDVRYVAIQTYVYSGERFNQVAESYSGWMVRETANANRATFDIKTVENKFNMVGDGTYAIPMIVDLKTSEIVFVDLYMNGNHSFNRVEGAVNEISTVAKELVNMVNTKPNMLDLLTYQMNASTAEIVENKEDATVTYGIKDCDNNVDRVDETLAELI